MKKFTIKYFIKLVVDGFLGGLLIAIGMMVLLNAPDKTVGAVLFSIGLLTINKFRLGLYTGKVGSVRNGVQLLETIVILLANAVGCLVILLYPTSNAVETLQAKMTFSHLDLFVKGLICGVLIFICVANKEKPLYTILAVPTFILCGAEHSIADIALVFAARMFTIDSFALVLVVAVGNAVGALLFSLLLDVKEKLETINDNKFDN